MSVMHNLTKSQMALALNLAMVLECGVVPVQYVIELFKIDMALTQRITEFWFCYNDMTRRALDMVIVETARQSFEVCYTKQAQGYHDLEK